MVFLQKKVVAVLMEILWQSVTLALIKKYSLIKQNQSFHKSLLKEDQVNPWKQYLTFISTI